MNKLDELVTQEEADDLYRVDPPSWGTVAVIVAAVIYLMLIGFGVIS